MAIQSAKIIFRTRELLAAFFHAQDPMKVIFTKNCTEALNLGIKGFLKDGDHVITTHMEHNSVMRPLFQLAKKKGIRITQVGRPPFGVVHPEDVERAIHRRTKLIVVTLSSNVTGLVMPIKEIGEIAKRRGVTFMVDAAQGAGVLPVDMTSMGIDMLAFPGHKGLLGPQGTGGLIINSDVKLEPLLLGGTGSLSRSREQPGVLPEGLESGTLNLPGIAGLESGVRYVESVGVEGLQGKKAQLITALFDQLKGVDGLTIYSPEDPKKNSGIFSFNINGIEAEDAAYTLNKKYRIALRAGLHCSPCAHQLLGTINIGCVRISPGAFNTFDEIKLAAQAIAEVSKM